MALNFVQAGENVELPVTSGAKSGDPEMVNRIREDIAQAMSLGVNGTPTVFVNGRMLRDWSMEGIEKAIQQELEKTNKATDTKKAACAGALKESW